MQNKEKLWKVASKKGKNIFEQIVLNRGISNLEGFINSPSPEETLTLILKGGGSLKDETVKAKKSYLHSRRL